MIPNMNGFQNGMIPNMNGFQNGMMPNMNRFQNGMMPNMNGMNPSPMNFQPMGQNLPMAIPLSSNFNIGAQPSPFVFR
jgi:hypothetical protein